MPGFYILDAKICPKKIEYVLKVVKYIIPADEQKIKTFMQENNGEPIEESMAELYEDNEELQQHYKTQNVVLKLIHQTNILTVVKEVPIVNAYKVNIAFSNDGKYFALFRRRVNILQIYEIDNDDIEGLMDKVAAEQYLKQYANLDILKNAQTMLFDLNSRYLACYGREVINIINLKSEERKIDTEGIDQKMFK